MTSPAASGNTTGAFVYAGDGKRVKSIINTETILFIGGHYEIKNPGSEQIVTKYYGVYGAHGATGIQRVAMRTGSTLTYLLGDHLGSTSSVTNASGGLVMETRYKPWGEVRYATANTTLPTRYTYTGQYSYINDDATYLGSAGFGLMFYNARWYDPYLGRFAQPDTIVPDPLSSQDWDRYAYVRYAPVRYVDPSGRIPKEEICKYLGVCGEKEFLKKYGQEIHDTISYGILR